MLKEQVLVAKQGYFKGVPLRCLAAAELQGHKQLPARGPPLAHPLRRENAGTHPAAAGIRVVLRRGSGAQPAGGDFAGLRLGWEAGGTPRSAKPWRQGAVRQG